MLFKCRAQFRCVSYDACSVCVYCANASPALRFFRSFARDFHHSHAHDARSTHQLRYMHEIQKNMFFFFVLNHIELYRQTKRKTTIDRRCWFCIRLSIVPLDRGSHTNTTQQQTHDGSDTTIELIQIMSNDKSFAHKYVYHHYIRDEWMMNDVNTPFIR